MAEKNEDWLTNSSFQVAPNERVDPDVEIIDSDDDEPPAKQKKHSKKKKKKEHRHHKDKQRPKSSETQAATKNEPKSEFTGKENYYVDKKPCNSYFSMETLKRDDSARYRVHFHYVGTLTSQQWRILHRRTKDKSKRYFTKHKSDKVKSTVAQPIMAPEGDGGSVVDDEKETSKNHRLSEEEFTAKTKVLNKNLLANATDIDAWLEYVRFQEHFYMKMTKVQMAERKMEILNKALRDNPSNERLYREYIDILEQAYPSFEVSKFLETLIQKGKT